MLDDRRSRRIIELDATRGAAMLFVCLSHSAVFMSDPSGFGARALVIIGMVATPTFLLLSGIVCGCLGTIAKDSVDRFRWRLVDRGIFVLVVVHLVTGVIHGLWWPILTTLSSSFYLTDAVAIGLIVAAATAQRASARTLATIGIMLLVTAWVVSNLDVASDALGRRLLRLFFGVFDVDDSDEGYVVPLVPYLGIFAIGVGCGIEYVLRKSAGMTTRELSRLCVRAGVASMAFAIMLKIGWLEAKPYLDATWRSVLYPLTEPLQKLPPGIAHLAAYGGAGVTMMGIVGMVSQSALGKRVISVFAVVGRASLVVFVVQYLVYFFPGRGLHIGMGYWLWIFPPSIVFLWCVAWVWDRFDGNRWLTVGLRSYPDRAALRLRHSRADAR